ncbi:MAG TPA: protease pro-enzyme activation domain-containing protein [Candidatus Baltobacteraceae bacterium]|nr:protease pro-enzyme activation domain-containing protein [Candidatus Baltobacteraceae bacterium]
MSATVPTGDPTPSARNERGRFTLGIPNTPVAYFDFSVSNTVTITQSPGFTVVLPSSVTVTAGNAYAVVYAAGLTTGWEEVAGPVAAGNTMTFPAAAVSPSPFTLTAGVHYIFAIVTTGTVVIPTPTPTPSPTPVPTATPTGTGTATPAPTPTLAPTLAPTTNPNGFSPSQVANAFQFPVQSGYNGAGQTIVILGDYSPTQSDLNTYLAAFGITSAGASFTTVPINGFVAPGTDTNGQGEATLDVETVAGLAPGATIEYYAMPSLTGSNFTLAYTQLTNDANASVMTASFGGCEYSGYSDATQDPLLAQAAAKGITMFASSGDQGNECFTGGTPQFSPGPNYPASDPNVVGVGGQENFTAAGTCPAGPSGSPSLTSVAVWNDCFFSSGQGASGGGVSTLFTPPPYQTGYGISTTFRNVPDIAMPAEGVAINLQGAWATYGGTSWSSPLAAAMTAEINEYCGGSMVFPAASSPVARFYTAFSRASSNFLDITTGNNQFATSTPFYSAATGYDNVTGLGAPYGMLVAAALCPSHVASAHPMTAMHGTAAVAIDTYGVARDTSLGFVPHLAGTTDMGSRGSAPVKVVLVMRATPTLASDEANVVSSLQAAGFTITQTFPNHLAIAASAPASTVDRYFQTSIHNVSQSQYGMRYANTAPVVLPASIARVVHGAIVDNLVIARWFHHRIVPLH